MRPQTTCGIATFSPVVKLEARSEKESHRTPFRLRILPHTMVLLVVKELTFTIRQIRFGLLMEESTKQMVSSISTLTAGKLVTLVSFLVELHYMKEMYNRQLEWDLLLVLISRHQENRVKEILQQEDLSNSGAKLVSMPLSPQKLRMTTKRSTATTCSGLHANLISSSLKLMFQVGKESLSMIPMQLLRHLVLSLFTSHSSAGMRTGMIMQHSLGTSKVSTRMFFQT